MKIFFLKFKINNLFSVRKYTYTSGLRSTVDYNPIRVYSTHPEGVPLYTILYSCTHTRMRLCRLVSQQSLYCNVNTVKVFRFILRKLYKRVYTPHHPIVYIKYIYNNCRSKIYRIKISYTIRRRRKPISGHHL